MEDRLQRHIAPILIAALAIAAGVALRVLHIASYPLWLDEAYSAFAARQDFDFLWHVVPRYETHPPFYYAMLHVWRGVFGGSVIALRMPGLLCGCALIAVTARAGLLTGRIAGFDRAGRTWMACMAPTLAALQPLAITMTHQVRPYPVMMLVYAVAIVALLEIASAERGRLPRRWLATFLFAQALMAWLHALGGLYGLSLGLALLVVSLRQGLGRAGWGWLVAGEAIVGLVYLPAFLIALEQQRAWTQSTWLRFDPHAAPATLGFIYLTWNRWAQLIAAIGIVAGIGMIGRRREGRAVALALAILALLPTALSLLVSVLRTPVFLDRTLSPVAVAGFVLMAACFGRAGIARLAAGALAACALASAIQIDLYAARRPPVQDWHAAADWLVPKVDAGDAVWAYPNEGALPLDEALAGERRALAIRQLPGPMPYLGPLGSHPTGSMGTVSLNDAEIAALLDRPDAAAPRTIWLVRLTADLYDPRNDFVRALAARRTPIARFRSGPIDIIGFRRRASPPVAPPQQPQP